MSILQFSNLLIFCKENKARQRTNYIVCKLEKSFRKMRVIKKNALRIKNMLEGYQNNRIELALNGLSNNFHFVSYFDFSPVLYPIFLCVDFVLNKIRF